MVDVFEEVSEDIKEEEFNKWLKKYGVKIIIASVLLVILATIRVVYTNHKASINQEQTVVLSDTMDVSFDKDIDDKVEQITARAKEVDEKHKFLFDFLKAGSYAEEGNLIEANKVYEEIINNKSVSEDYKSLASVYLSQNILNMEDGDLNKAKKLISPMLSKEDPYYYVAMEQKALMEAKLGNTKEAKSIFTNLFNDEDAPEGVKNRAEKLKTLY